MGEGRKVSEILTGIAVVRGQACPPGGVSGISGSNGGYETIDNQGKAVPLVRDADGNERLLAKPANTRSVSRSPYMRNTNRPSPGSPAPAATTPGSWQAWSSALLALAAVLGLGVADPSNRA